MKKTDRGCGAVHTVAMIGNHLPRQCGIATFTTDLSQAIHSEGGVECFVLAMNEAGRHHDYPPQVRVEIDEGDVTAFRRAADYLNASAVDVVSLQHEYGIFGARAGANILELLQRLRVPIVTTLHTIIASPSRAQRNVLEAILALSERVVVMSNDGASLLRELHGVAASKIDVIPHGIPAIPECQGKAPLGAEDCTVLFTFGLLSPDKGIEYVIAAMPEILRRHPNTLYIVLGATHPHIKQQHGEEYRTMLESSAQRLGVEDSVLFHNRFACHEELVGFLSAADIYITPYLKEEQSTSGTLAYAIGCGKAVISTPYRYAREMLAEGRGILVPWRDPEAISREIIGLLDDPRRRAALQQRAAAFGQTMGWPIVARRYVTSFRLACAAYTGRREAFRESPPKKRSPEPPELNLSHVRTMTDDTGILQHATFNIPSYQDGYCTDDNARALLLMALLEEEGAEKSSPVRALASRYLAFLNHALDRKSARFKNFLTYDRRWHEEPGSDDCHGRALWALGAVVARSLDPGHKSLAAQLFRAALPAAISTTSPRAWAYTLLGVSEYLRAFRGDSSVEQLGTTLARRLVECYRLAQKPGWLWFEDRLTYANARLPQALLAAAAWMEDPESKQIGERTLGWLVEQCSADDGTFSPIGSEGFYVRESARALFDQQPIEACATVSACLDAQRATGQHHWGYLARHAFDWFLGKNALHSALFDATTGGCRDGLHAERMNENQGAESTLSFLLAATELRASERRLRPAPPARLAPSWALHKESLSQESRS